MLDRTLYRGTAGGAELVVAVSEREREDLVAGGVDPAKTRVRGNGFPDTRVRPLKGSDPFPYGPVVLYVGRIAAGKGLEHLVAAAKAIPDVHVVIVGPDDRHGADRSLAGDRVHVLPPTDEPPFDLYRAAAVFVLPSAGESFGMAAAEAASVGTPVVVTDRCGVASSFREGEALVVPYDRDAITGAIARVLREPELRERLSLGGLEAPSRSASHQALVVGTGRRRAGVDLPRVDRLAHSGDEAFDGRLVTPLADDFLRPFTKASAQVRVEELPNRSGRSRRFAGRNDEAVLTVP